MKDKKMKWHLNKKVENDEWHGLDSLVASQGITAPNEGLTPNMQALRLAMTAGDQLLSMGVSANGVVASILDITETFCSQPVHVDINSNLIMLSQIRGVDKEPLTLLRPTVGRKTNYTTVQNIQQLIRDIREKKYSLREAESQLETILREAKQLPWWLTMMGNGLLVAGVTLLSTTSWKMILTTFLLGMTVDRLLYFMALQRLPLFYRQVISAFFVTMTAAIIKFLSSSGVEFFDGFNPTIIVVGGIVMLLSGLAIVSAIQDAIDEYYITANARISKVILQTAGIVIGVLAGLYTARKLGMTIGISPTAPVPTHLPMQIMGAAIASAGYALATQIRTQAILGVGLIGGSVAAIMYANTTGLSLSTIAASGLAAFFVGVIASIMSRLWRTPSVGVIAAGIIPLVPGLALYNGLMQTINFPPGSPLFLESFSTLTSAAAIALVIGAGASFGRIIGRPINQKIVHARNFQPFMQFMREQLGQKPPQRLPGILRIFHRKK